MNRIIIPICVEALLANGRSVDRNRAPVYGPDYRKVSYVSMLGSKNTPGDFQMGEVHEAGAHLHFILPDALTHAGEEGYPAVPDRYLVTRLYEKKDGQIASKCFLVESNFMSRDSRYSKSITIPLFHEQDLRKNWSYLGRSYPIRDIPEQCDTDGYLETLTALGPGDPMFAAYYPSCSSVFGFYDPLEDVEPGTVLTYVAAGYYSDPKKDPFSAVGSKGDMEEILTEMRLSVREDGAVCSGCVLFGQITGVRWEGKGADYDPEPAGTIDVSVGHTSAEALAAAIVRDQGVQGEEERIITALQYDLMNSDELPDGNYRMDDEIYLRQFQRLDGEETGHELVLKENSDYIPALGKAFSGVRCAGEKLAEEKRRLTSLRKKLYTAWEQYMYCYEDPSLTPKGVPSREEMLSEINRIAREEIPARKTKVAVQEKHLRTCRETFCQSAGAAADIVETAAPPFYAPKDPVILLSGEGVKRAYAFGEDGRFSQDGTMLCQTGIVRTNAAAGEILSCLEEIPPVADFLENYEELLCQALLLSEDCLPVIRKRLGEVAVLGNEPSEIACNRYHRNPITLWMIWEAQYLPTSGEAVPDAVLEDWRWEESQTDYVYTGGKKPEQLSGRYLTGRIVLTPHATLQLSREMEKWGAAHPEQKGILEMAGRVRNMGILSQNMDGFVKGMLSLKHTFQFPVMGAGGDEDMAQAVREEADGERESIIADQSLRHLRGGMMGISRLNLIGTFGQVEVVMDNSYFGKKKIAFSETMGKVDDSYALLSPAFHEPVRLEFHFLSAKDDGILSSPAPETSPVYGIIVPELLNRRLLIYEAGGEYAGSVNTVYRNGREESVWVNGKDPRLLFEETVFEDRRLGYYVEGLLRTEYALQDLLVMMEHYYEKKLMPEAKKQIWGRPFVLARCGVRLAFSGMPEYDKSLSSFGKYDTGQAENIRIPVMFGGMNRVTDGVLGCFEDADEFRVFHPCFGSSLPSAGTYFHNTGGTEICAAEGEKRMTLLMEPRGKVTVQTGIMPGMSVELNDTHGQEAERICMEAEMNPVLSAKDAVSLPVEGFSFKYRDGDTYYYNEVIPQIADFASTVIMDGYIVRDGKGGRNGKQNGC